MPSHLLSPRPCKPPSKRTFADFLSDDLETADDPAPPHQPPRSPSSKPLPGIESERTRCTSAPPDGRTPSLQDSRYRSVDAWVLAISKPTNEVQPVTSARPSTCPPSLDSSQDRRVPLTAQVLDMSHSQYAASSQAASQSSKSNVSHPTYRSTLWHNHISLDISGRKLPAELRRFTDSEILQQRSSPQLADEAVTQVLDIVEELADATESPASKLARSGMFPFDARRGIAEGGNSLWRTLPLPRNPDFQTAVAAPKPDLHFGYSTNQRSEWSATQSNVINHPVAGPYTTPARGNTFPFLMVEIKSEATGGTLFVAENQAAGSGSHSVNALLWLLREAEQHGSFQSSPCMDTVAFSIIMSHREAIFHVHWYSEVDRRYYMSFLRSYSTLSPTDIRACNNTVKNIIDYGLGSRRTTISAALEALFPFPEQWKQARPPPTAPMTPSTFLDEDERAAKRRMVQ